MSEQFDNRTTAFTSVWYTVHQLVQQCTHQLSNLELAALTRVYGHCTLTYEVRSVNGASAAA